MELVNITTDILTIEEVRRRLPRVRIHVQRVMEAAIELVDLNGTLADLRQRSSPEPQVELKLVDRLRELEAVFQAEVRAINELGGYLKDPSSGLVDFYSWRDDDLVFLCWRHGEDTVRHWHALREGFRNRKPIEA